MKKYTTLIAGLFALIFLVSFASASTVKVASCQVLDKPNTTYVIVKDITSSNNICLQITAPNIIIDGNRRTITNENSNSATGVIIGKDARNTTIKNLNLQEFNIGILIGSDGNAIQDNTIGSTTDYSTGISAQFSRDNLITNNTINLHSPNSANGIYVFADSNNNQITNNQINTTSENTANAIYFYNPFNSTYPYNNLLSENILNSSNYSLVLDVLTPALQYNGVTAEDVKIGKVSLINQQIPTYLFKTDKTKNGKISVSVENEVGEVSSNLQETLEGENFPDNFGMRLGLPETITTSGFTPAGSLIAVTITNKLNLSATLKVYDLASKGFTKDTEGNYIIYVYKNEFKTENEVERVAWGIKKDTLILQVTEAGDYIITNEQAPAEEVIVTNNGKTLATSSGESSSSGGGGGSTYTLIKSEWGECIDGVQTKEAYYINHPENILTYSRACEMPVDLTENNVDNTTPKEERSSTLSGITGAVVGAIKKPVTWLIVVGIVLGIIYIASTNKGSKTSTKETKKDSKKSKKE